MTFLRDVLLAYLFPQIITSSIVKTWNEIKAPAGIDFFHLFTETNCIIHFSIRENQPWSSIHDKIINHCSASQSNCVTIQTNSRRRLPLKSVAWNGSKDSAELLLRSMFGYKKLYTFAPAPLILWEHFGFENWFPIQFVIGQLRFTSFCVVQLAVANPRRESRSNLDLLYLPVRKWWENFHDMRFRAPDYLLFYFSYLNVSAELSMPTGLPWQILV